MQKIYSLVLGLCLTLCVLFNINGQDFDPPGVDSFSPANGETDVVPIAGNFGINFDEEVSMVDCHLISLIKSSDQTIIAQFETFSIGVFTSRAINFGGVPLEKSTTYHVKIPAGAFVDTSGNEFIGVNDSDTWSFTTTDNETADPLATGFFPSDDQLSVDVTFNSFTIFFDELVERVPGKVAALRLSSDGSLVSEIMLTSTSFASTQSLFFADVMLAPATTYYLTVESGAFRDVFGNEYLGISNEETWSFTTEDGDSDVPVVTSFNPSDGSTNVGLNTTSYRLNFDEVVQRVGQKTVSIVRSSDNQAVATSTLSSSSFFSSGWSVFFNGDLLLEPATEYHIIVAPGSYIDRFGNEFAGISTNDVWSFTTENSETDPPVISSLTPGDESIGVSTTPEFSILFDETVKSQDGKKAELFRAADDTKVSEVILSQSNFLSTTQFINFPSVVLEANTTYYVLIEEDAFRDKFGSSFAGIANSSTWNFTTGVADSEAPILTCEDPVNGSIDISVTDRSFSFETNEVVRSTSGKKISIIRSSDNTVFDEITTFESSFSSQFQSFSFNYTALEASTRYHINMESGAYVDKSGNALPGISDSDTWSFTTQAPDNDAPLISSFTPSDGASNVSVIVDFFSLQFNEQVRQIGGKSISLKRSSDDALIRQTTTSESSFFGTNWSFGFSNLILEPSTSYYFTVESGSHADPFGNVFSGISDDQTWSFTTQAGETEPPQIEFLFPSGPGSQSVFLNNFVVDFDEAVRQVGCKIITLIRTDDGEVIIQTVTDDTGSFQSSQTLFLGIAQLDPGTAYHVNIEEGAFVDVFGNGSEAITDSETWSFTTVEPETDPPGVSEFSPLNGSEDVSLTQSFYRLIFDESVRDIGGKKVSLRLVSDGSLVDEVTTGESTSFTTVYEFFFSSDGLEPGTAYYIEIEEGAFVDFFGNPFGGISGPNIWSFTTEQAEEDAPGLFSTSPSNASTGVFLFRNSFTLNFDEPVRENAGFEIAIKRSLDDATIATLTTIESGFSSSKFISFQDVNFEASTQYYITVEAEAYEDFFGNKFGGILDKNTWTFEIEAEESEPPRAFFFSPNTGTLGNDIVDDSYRVNFDEEVKQVEGKLVQIHRSDNDEVVAQLLTSENDFFSSSVTFLFNNLKLEASTSYYVTIEAGAVVDVFDNEFAGITEVDTWQFTTECARTDRPMVVSLSPDNGMRDISPYPASSSTIRFDRRVTRINGSDITLNRSADNSIALESNIFDSQFQFTHTVFPGINLASSTTYHILIPAGAFVDAFGNEFAGILTPDGWSFTTANVTSIGEGLSLELAMYPVPVNDFLYIHGGEMLIGGLEVFTLNGAAVFQQNFNSSVDVEVDLSILNPGVYIVKVWDTDRTRQYSQRIIKN